MADALECLTVSVSDFVATVTIDRPPVNAQNRQFRQEIVAVFDSLSDRTDVRAIVLTGAGKTFSAGADLKERPGLALLWQIFRTAGVFGIPAAGFA